MCAISKITEDQSAAGYLGWLMTQVAEGSHDAFAELFAETRKGTYDLLLQIMKKHQDAEDVLSAVYLQVWTHATGYDSARATPIGWITMIARSRAIDRVRSNAFHESHWISLDETRGVSVRKEFEELTLVKKLMLKKVLKSAVKVLTAEQMALIDLSYFFGMSQAEIAAYLDWPLGTVKTRMRAGLSAIRRCFFASTKVPMVDYVGVNLNSGIHMYRKRISGKHLLPFDVSFEPRLTKSGSRRSPKT